MPLTHNCVDEKGILQKKTSEVILLLVSWIFVISQMEVKKDHHKKSSGKRQRLIKLVHKGTNTKEMFRCVLKRSWSRVLEGVNWGKSYVLAVRVCIYNWAGHGD